MRSTSAIPKAACVYVFAGGIDEQVPPVLVSGDGSVTDGGYPWAPQEINSTQLHLHKVLPAVIHQRYTRIRALHAIHLELSTLPR
jgi:hypothetical protein